MKNKQEKDAYHGSGYVGKTKEPCWWNIIQKKAPDGELVTLDNLKKSLDKFDKKSKEEGAILPLNYGKDYTGKKNKKKF